MRYTELSKKPLPELDKFSIVLCGGGAAGRWQAGVLTAMAQQGVVEQASVIVGTSVGGLNAGLFTAFGSSTLPDGENMYQDGTSTDRFSIDEDCLSNFGLSWDITSMEPPPPYYQAVNIWESITKNSDVYKGSFTNFWDKLGAGFGFLFGRDSILDPKPLHTTIQNIFKTASLESISEIFNTQLIISALDLTTQTEEFYTSFGPNRSLAVSDVLKRTSAIPGIFSSIKGVDYGDGDAHWHVDGGVGANNPFIALNKYNDAFPNNPVHKVLIVFCYPDNMRDAESAAHPHKSYKSFKDVLFRTVPSAMHTQEQIVEMLIEDKVKHSSWEVMALWPNKVPCDSLDFTKTQLLQEGYDYGVRGMGYSYKSGADISILDFLKKR